SPPLSLRFLFPPYFTLSLSPPCDPSVTAPLRRPFSPNNGAFTRRPKEVFDKSRLSSRGAFDYFGRVRHVFHVLGLPPQNPRPSEQCVELSAQLVRGHRHIFIPRARGMFSRFAQPLFTAPAQAIFDGD